VTGEEERLTPALFDSRTEPERDSDEALRLRDEVERLTERVAEQHEIIQGWARYGERVKADRARFGDMLIAALGLQHEPVSRHFHRLVPQACEEIARLRVDVERLTAGADPTPAEPGAVLTPGQWIARWNAATAEERLEQVRHLQDMADMAGRCFALDHEGRLSEEIPMLRHEIERLRALADHDAQTGSCVGCGSTRITTRKRVIFCTEPTCDRRLPGPPCERCTRPRSLHVCLSCSPDELTAGPGCHNCRNTGWNQTPCLPPVAVTR
jgi:hypothetical protein